MSANELPDNGTYGVFTVPQVAQYYNFPKGLTGKGQRIAIFEFDGGYHDSDLESYFQVLGIPKPSVTDHVVKGLDNGLPLSGSKGPLTIKTIQAIVADWRKPGITIQGLSEKYGGPTGDFGQFAATHECTMDIAIAGSVAPGAEIHVFFAPKTPDSFANAIQDALAIKASVICCSWGGAEYDRWDPGQMEAIDKALAKARKEGVTVCCGVGDEGSQASRAREVAQLANVQFPASSPNVLACGGTRLLHKDGCITGEVAWNQDWLDYHRASGGGMSGVFPKPEFQKNIQTPNPTPGIWIRSHAQGFDGRWVPDVAANADIHSAYKMVLGGKKFVAIETSAAAPLWAGLIALLGEAYRKPLPWLPELLYSPGYARALNDITQGNNTLPGAGGCCFQAGPGWDPCTGLGSPNGEALLKALKG